MNACVSGQMTPLMYDHIITYRRAVSLSGQLPCSQLPTKYDLIVPRAHLTFCRRSNSMSKRVYLHVKTVALPLHWLSYPGSYPLNDTGLSAVQNEFTDFFSEYSIVICSEATVCPLYGTEALSTRHTSPLHSISCSDRHLTVGNTDRNVSSLYTATAATLTARVCHLAACRRLTAVSRGFGKCLRCLTAKFEWPCGVRVQNSSEHKHNGR